MCLNYARRIWIKLLFPTPLCWMLLNIISWSVMISTQTKSHNQKQSFELINILISESQFIKSSLLINGFCWLCYPGLGVIIILREECLECDRERLLWSSDGSHHMISATRWQSPAPANLPGSGPAPKCDERLDTRSFYFLRTYSFCEDDTIDLLKRVDSIQTQRRRGQDSWIALKKL